MNVLRNMEIVSQFQYRELYIFLFCVFSILWCLPQSIPNLVFFLQELGYVPHDVRIPHGIRVVEHNLAVHIDVAQYVKVNLFCILYHFVIVRFLHSHVSPRLKKSHWDQRILVLYDHLEFFHHPNLDKTLLDCRVTTALVTGSREWLI